MDLNGNTFWEFKDSLESNRFRRIAQAHDPRVPYADLKISRMSGPPLDLLRDVSFIPLYSYVSSSTMAPMASAYTLRTAKYDRATV